MRAAHSLFTSESVTEGHPDKLCDQISDAVLDAILVKDPYARVACETATTTGLVLVFGEITTDTYVDIPAVTRATVAEAGYTNAELGFDSETSSVLTSIKEQSPEISMGVSRALEVRDGQVVDELELIGAGDQGMMIGFACDETPWLMPLPISLAHAVSKRLADARKSRAIPYLRPDGKCQFTVEYEHGRPLRVDTIVISTQHDPDVPPARMRDDLIEGVIRPMVPAELLDDKTRILINPSGSFVLGGPMGDAGLTGRKIIVDTYGGMARHGGGAFSGKDPTKVDRSGAYAARYVAKNVVAAGLADRFELQISYAIGVAHPVSLYVETFGTARVPEETIQGLIRRHFDLRPAAIIRDLDLRRPLYKKVAVYGHFGRPDLDLPWERTDKAAALREEAG
ncbi:MAG TPA: methionine adenosyltransferase, partial [Thermomicrobiaceae bacterium]|nr:methionine adenosyltransferase [Thermomicrobiaceae bacterium]